MYYIHARVGTCTAEGWSRCLHPNRIFTNKMSRQIALALGAAAAAAAAAILVLRRWRRRPAFAPMVRALPANTLANLTRHRWLALRHHVAEAAVDVRRLEALFDDIRAHFAPQQVDYSNTAYGKDHWKLSCFLEYSNGVAAGKVDLAKGAPLLAVCGEILAECDTVFLEWYDRQHPYVKTATRTLTRLQSFVTRYRPNADETHLPRHIDGANVDGSLVLGLPTYDAFGDSGGLTVWDGENDAEEFVYPVAAGDCCLLDSRVWHQSNPITHGERWVIVVFYGVKTTKAPKAGAIAATAATNVADPPTGGTASAGLEPSTRAREVRELLARRIKDAAKRREVTEQVIPSAGAAAWQG